MNKISYVLFGIGLGGIYFDRNLSGFCILLGLIIEAFTELVDGSLK